jgi:beta-lactamase regulating signal transducer with metallopeptidase domain
LTLGTLRPVILLPSDWLEWPSSKLQAVLAHELTHVERADCAVTFIA